MAIGLTRACGRNLDLAKGVAGELGGQIGVAPRVFQDPAQPAAGAQSERDLRTDDRQPAPGDPRPAAYRQ